MLALAEQIVAQVVETSNNKVVVNRFYHASDIIAVNAEITLLDVIRGRARGQQDDRAQKQKKSASHTDIVQQKIRTRNKNLLLRCIQ